MGNSGSFKKGNIPWNKGNKDFRPSKKTEFKSGEHHTGKHHPSWKGGVQKIKSDCTHIWTGNGKRARRPRLVYEQNFGPIPKGYVIIHLDGNKDNDSPDNLKAISRAENMNRNNPKLK